MAIKLLAIIPHEDIARTLNDVAEDYPEVELTVRVGDLEEGLKATLSLFDADYDAIISRGGTAQILESQLSAPVVEIEITTSDVLGCLAQLKCKPDARVAAVGFHNAISHVERAARLTEHTVDIFPVAYAKDVTTVLTLISTLGYDALLCDAVSCTRAAELGLEATLLTSGEDSIRDTLERAIFHVRNWRHGRQQIQALRAIVRNQPGNLVIFNQAGKLVYSDLTESQTKVLEYLEERRGDGCARYTMQRDGRLYRINATVTEPDSGGYTVFNISSSRKQPAGSFPGIEHLDRAEVEAQYRMSIYGVGLDTAGDSCPAVRRLGELMRRAEQLDRPVLFRGEVGSGKDMLVRKFYLESRATAHPFILVDCSVLQEQSWHYLLDSPHSPIFGSGQTIAFTCLDALAAHEWRRLLATILKVKPEQRNRLLISGNERQDVAEGMWALSTFSSQLHCLEITVPPLRKQRDLIVPTALAWLDVLAEESGEEARLDEDALADIAAYSWPRNFIQLKQVLDWMYAMRASATLGRAELHEALAREHVALFSSTASPTADTVLDLMRPLEEIQRDVIRAVVRACRGNRTQAAEVLKISRTTIWRLLNDDGEDA